jgi:ferrous iron transport protein A
MSRLAQLAVGSSARVTQVHGDGSVSRRLLEMGLTPGADVTVIGQAPLGDPLELELRGYHLSLRKSEAQCVEVEPLAAR